MFSAELEDCVVVADGFVVVVLEDDHPDEGFVGDAAGAEGLLEELHPPDGEEGLLEELQPPEEELLLERPDEELLDRPLDDDDEPFEYKGEDTAIMASIKYVMSFIAFWCLWC